jgi:hypothetical protein
LTKQLLPSAALAIRLRSVRRFVIGIDQLMSAGLFEDPAAS